MKRTLTVRPTAGLPSTALNARTSNTAACPTLIGSARGAIATTVGAFGATICVVAVALCVDATTPYVVDRPSLGAGTVRFAIPSAPVRTVVSTTVVVPQPAPSAAPGGMTCGVRI